MQVVLHVVDTWMDDTSDDEPHGDEVVGAHDDELLVVGDMNQMNQMLDALVVVALEEALFGLSYQLKRNLYFKSLLYYEYLNDYNIFHFEDLSPFAEVYHELQQDDPKMTLEKCILMIQVTWLKVVHQTYQLWLHNLRQ